MTFGEALLVYLEKLDISQSELARRMNTGRQTINSIINNSKHGPWIDTAIEISDALGVPLQDIIDLMKSDEPYKSDTKGN